MDSDEDDVETQKVFQRNKDLLPQFPQNDDFLRIIRSVFHFARWFGIPSYGGGFSLIWCMLLFCMLITMELGALWKFYRAVFGIAICTAGGRSVIARLSGSIFYANAVVSTVLSWRFANSWKTTSHFWTMTERTSGAYFPPDEKLRTRLVFVISLVATCSIVEHSLSMMSATGFNFPSWEYFERYILSSHGFLLRKSEFTLWLGVPIFLLSKTATCLWNFQDSIIILISIGLTSRYRRLNLYVKMYTKGEFKYVSEVHISRENEDFVRLHTWRKIREAYVRQADLVRRVSRELGGLILLSNLNNFYFICLQLFLGLGGENPSLINKLYYLSSLSWLIFRACSVVLAAADINVQSRVALKYMHACPERCYNIEASRLEKQLCKDKVALSGKGFFFIDRTMLLKVAAAILTYELVLLQYDT